MSRQNFLWLISTSLISLAAGFLALSSLIPPHGPLQFIRGFPGADEGLVPQLAVLARALRLVDDNYVHELQPQDRHRLLSQALEAALQSLDEHSSYIPPEPYRRFEELEQGHFGGIGVQVGLHPLTGQLMVQSPIPNTPALRAGLRSGDIILAVNGEKVSNIEEAVNRIKGPPGTKVSLTLRPWGESTTRIVELERGEIPIESVNGYQRSANGQWDFWLDSDHGLAYVHLEGFNPTAPSELHNVLSSLAPQGLRGLVLDLRGNPGGRLETAIEISELFLPAATPIVTVRGRRRAQETYFARDSQNSPWRRLKPQPAALRDLPLIILIDGQSASASEIVASALQDNKRALLIGQRTFGKASVQTIIPLPPNNHALKLTTAEYLRPSGKNIHRFRTSSDSDTWGVTPDILVPLSPEEQQRILLSRRFRDIFWQSAHSQDMQERFSVSTALLGSSGSLIDPDNSIYIRHLLARKEVDLVLERARQVLLERLPPK